MWQTLGFAAMGNMPAQHFSLINPSKMLSIMAWKVARLLVKLKNMTRGLKSLQLVLPLISVLHPNIIETLLDIDLSEILSTQSLLTNSEINRSGYLFLTVIALRAR